MLICPQAVEFHRPAVTLFLVLALSLLASPRLASAFGGFCDVIPQVEDRSSGDVGGSTRVALIPGFPAEVFVRPGICQNDARSVAPGFVVPGAANRLTEGQVALNFAFNPLDFSQDPPAAAASNIVVVRRDCSGVAQDACGAAPAPAVYCIEDTTGQLEFRDLALPGGDGAVESRLQYLFPDTTGLGGRSAPFVGPVQVAVTLADDPIPCGLATQTCRSFGGPVVSCVGDLYQLGTCERTDANIDGRTVNLTALPVPNRFSDLCAVDPNDPGGPTRSCNADPSAAPTLALTTDKRGNFMGAADNRDILIVIEGQRQPRLIQAGTSVAGVNLTPPTPSFTKSLSTTFGRLLPFFAPRPLVPGEQTGIGVASTDAAFGINYAIRHGCSGDASLPCSTDAQCAAAGAGTCSVDAWLPRVAGSHQGTGPIEAICPLDTDGLPVCRVLGSVTLDIVLNASNTESRAITAQVNECVAADELGGSVNGDGDLEDVVMSLLDRVTLRRPDIGGASLGQAETRILDRGDFSLSSSAVDGDVLAYLVSEFAECDFSLDPDACDLTGNGVPFDHALRVVRFDAATQGWVALDAVQPVEPDVNVESASVAVSDGRVFFRAPESHLAPVVATVLTDAGDVALSPDGNDVALTTRTKFFKPDGKSSLDVYLGSLDIQAGLPTIAALEPVSIADESCFSSRLRFSNYNAAPAVSGRDAEDNVIAVAFDSDWAKLLDRPKGKPQDTNDARDVFVHRFEDCRTIRVSVSSAGAQSESGSVSSEPSISGDGCLVTFQSTARNLVPETGGAAAISRVYLHDLCSVDPVSETLGVTTLISPVGDSATASTGEGLSSADEIAYTTDGVEPGSDVFVDDGVAVTLASAALDGGEAGGSFEPTISKNGRWVTFSSDASDLTDPPASNGRRNVYVHDRTTGTTRRAGVLRVPSQCLANGAAGFEPDGDSSDPRVSEDGRFLVYSSAASNLAPGADAAGAEVFIEDLLTGAIASVSAPGSGGGGASSSSDTSVVAFEAGGDVVVRVHKVDASGSVLGMLDASSSSPQLLEDPAEFVKVASGRALFAAPATNGSPAPPVKLFPCEEAWCSGATESMFGGAPGVSAEDAIALTPSYACAIVASNGTTVPRCRDLSTGNPVSLPDVPGANSIKLHENGTPGAANLVLTAGTERTLWTGQLAGGAANVAQVSAIAIESFSTGDVVVGDVACFSALDPLDPTALPRMFVVDPLVPDRAQDCFRNVLRCDRKACDPRVPFTNVPTRTCKHLTLETGVDLNGNGVVGEELLARCTLGDDVLDGVVVAVNNPGTQNVLGGEGAVGELNQSPACVIDDPTRPELRVVPEGPCGPAPLAMGDPPRCPAGQVCSEEIFGCSRDLSVVCTCAAGALCEAECGAGQTCERIVLDDQAADSDGDGRLDRNETCPFIDNPDPGPDCGILEPAALQCGADPDGDFVCGGCDLVAGNPNACTRCLPAAPLSENGCFTFDCDEDGIDDECDAFVCGDGVVQAEEDCDTGLDATCPASCRERVVLFGVVEGSINPTQGGNGVYAMVSSPDVSPQTDVDVTSMRMQALSASVPQTVEECEELSGGVGTAHAGGHPSSDQNGDGIGDVKLHFSVQGSGIVVGTKNVCVTGTFSDTGDTFTSIIDVSNNVPQQ